MEKVFQLARQLSQDLKKTVLYTQYQDVKAKVSEDALLQSKLDDYRKGRLLLEMRRTNGEEVSLAEEQAMGNLYAEIIMHPHGAEFLRLEKQIMDAIENINTILYEDLSIDVNFLD